MELFEAWLKWEDRAGWIPTFVTVIILQDVFLSKTRITSLHSRNGIFSIKSKLRIWKHCRMQQKLHHFHKAMRQDDFFLDCNLLLSPMQTCYKRYACLSKKRLGALFNYIANKGWKNMSLQVIFFLVFISNSGLVCSGSLLRWES